MTISAYRIRKFVLWGLFVCFFKAELVKLLNSFANKSAKCSSLSLARLYSENSCWKAHN